VLAYLLDEITQSVAIRCRAANQTRISQHWRICQIPTLEVDYR
jgi:hypothetical protein